MHAAYMGKPTAANTHFFHTGEGLSIVNMAKAFIYSLIQHHVIVIVNIHIIVIVKQMCRIL